VCVINYGAFWRKGFGDWAMLLPWDVVVYDECHALCGANSKQSKYAARFYHKARYRFGLTGTPLPKAHASVYPLYRALDQTLFGTSKERHEQRYFIMGGFNNTEIVGVLHATEFRAKVNAIRFYVPAKDLKLPPVVESTIPIILPPAAWRVYTEMQTEYYAKIQSGEVTAANAAVASIRLRQITSGFLPVDQGPGTPKIITTVHTAKEDALRDFLESLPPKEPVVVFCHFKYDLAAVHSVAKSVHRFSSELSGSVKTHDAWKQGKTSVIACQLQAAAEGINLSRANYVVYYSLDFHWQHLEQSRERVRVHGKTDSIGVYHLTVRNSVDARIRSVLSRRGNVIEELLRVPLDIHN
jgi:SNF2 family DNA or RNA helicase